MRTLANAFEMNRIAHAFMLAGVRGVGKTTTARLLARAFNYETASCSTPSMNWEEEGVHCAAIMNGRHMDVVEMDAASHTGIADVREIIDRLQYAPTSARYKVYIVDEVHMLSHAAFNGLLKTLEEPPAHVKFVFATTEIRKVPVTILSRCQRFDLRRLDMDDMARLLQSVAQQEGVELAEEAMRMISRAAEGSARDALSLLDQAIAHAGGRGVAATPPRGAAPPHKDARDGGSGSISAAVVRDMLGLADQMRICDLFDAVMQGRAADALGIGRQLHDIGAEPMVILTDLADIAHWLTRLRLAPEGGDKSLASMPFGAQGEAWGAERARQISLRDLNRIWQMLLKGMQDTRAATKPAAAMDMLLARLAHAADMPHLDEALRQLAAQHPSAPAVPAAVVAAPGVADASAPAAPAPESAAPNASEGEKLRAGVKEHFPGAVLEGEESGEGGR